MTSSNAYMQALRMRLFREDVRRSAAFGQIIGTAAGLYGWFGYFIGETHSDGFYLTFCFGGALILSEAEDYDKTFRHLLWWVLALTLIMPFLTFLL